LDFSFKLSQLDNFLMPGAGWKGRGGSNAPHREEPPSAASGEKINITGKALERGDEEERRTSPAARTSGVFWWPHRRPLPKDRETSGWTLQGMRTRRLKGCPRREEEESSRRIWRNTISTRRRSGRRR
jgi:hypothetical protein